MQTKHIIHVVDSHTAGEPTRVVMRGGPLLGDGPLAERSKRFTESFDHFRSAIVNEPRGSDVLVGALLVEPHEPGCEVGVIFFNNVGVLGMCGHGTIGLVNTLQHLGKLKPGNLRIDTPVGAVTATLHQDDSVSVVNVASYRQAASVELQVGSVGRVVGDVAWGGNWFFLVKEPVVDFKRYSVGELLRLSTLIREEVNRHYPLVDHVELFGEPLADAADSRNFVLCPGGQYDRSPCGTGTSAKMACLAANGELAPGDTWIQESVVGTNFSGRYQWLDEERTIIEPTITGRAFITGQAELLLDPTDPFCWGFATK
jgi:4-hydroxyproline epimerase